ncbi:hypothetical protein FS837_011036 [Tulasnella sp. UAMH 9824]|nr:hypothetical protein FS837_011036 [Tulasnella sp. UAMH 9824]
MAGEQKELDTSMDSEEVIRARVSGLSAQILEMLRLSQSLPDPNTPRDCILNEIAARQLIFAEVQSQISDLKTRQNELLPVHHLPVEILAIILSTALSPWGYHRKRTSLLLVCRTWANVINTNPSTFWTTLSSDDPPGQHDRLLQMARRMPVNIHIDFYATNPASLRNLREDLLSKRLAFREVVFVGSNSSLADELLASCLFGPAPYLQSLDLTIYGGKTIGVDESDSPEVPMNSVSAPNLRNVRLYGVSLPWDAAILRGLRSLSLEDLGSSRSNTNPPTLKELVEIIRGCPDLRCLTLQGTTLRLDDQGKAPTGISSDQLTSLNLSNVSLQLTCDILQCIRFPSTAMVSITIEDLGQDESWRVDLGVILSRLTQDRTIVPVHLEIDRPHLTISAKNFQFVIPSPNEENPRYRTTYKELFSSLGAPTLVAVISLHIDSPASQNSTAILTAANEFFPDLSKLSISPYHRLKSKKPWHVVLEKVVKPVEETKRPRYLCPKLTSLEITARSGVRLDVASILQLVRTRTSNRKSKGKEVEKAPITSISINLQSGKLSSEQLGLLNELKGEVTDVHWVSPAQGDPVQIDANDPFESDSSTS